MLLPTTQIIRKYPRARVLGAYLYSSSYYRSKQAIYWQSVNRLLARLPKRIRYRRSTAWLLSDITNPITVSVPNVVGLTASAAVNALNAVKLSPSIQTAFSPQPIGTIVQQSPPAGSIVLTGSSVTIVESIGIAVPTLIGLTVTDANTALSTAGLIFGTQTGASSATVPFGIISAQAPAAGSGVAAGSSVSVTISTGPGPQGVMPYVVGQYYWIATDILQQVGILVPSQIGYFGTWPITIDWLASSQISGMVLSQSIAAGASVAVNSPISFTVSEYSVSVGYPAGGNTN